MEAVAKRERSLDVICDNITHISQREISCTYKEWGEKDICTGRLMTISVHGQISNRKPVIFQLYDYIISKPDVHRPS